MWLGVVKGEVLAMQYAVAMHPHCICTAYALQVQCKCNTVALQSHCNRIKESLTNGDN